VGKRGTSGAARTSPFPSGINLLRLSSVRPFRFGYQHMTSNVAELLIAARRAEASGIDVFHTFDHVGAGFSCLAPLVAVAGATERLRLCPLVLNNDWRHPVVLAQELATIDLLSSGRLEVGLGAGHSFTEYHSTGQLFDSPQVRKSRLAESAELIRRLLDGEVVTHSGDFYNLDEASIIRSHQDHVPILIGVNGREALSHAAMNADTIGLTMFGKTLPDGQRHEARWQADRLDSTVVWISEAAASDPVTLNCTHLSRRW
jgi:probable F420-dependent oxidoreductase